MATAYWRQRRQRTNQNVFDYQYLIDSPHDLDNTDLMLPANGFLAFSCTNQVAAGDASVTVGADQYLCPALNAGSVYWIPWQEEDEILSAAFHAGTPGGVDVYILDEWRRHYLIAFYRNRTKVPRDLTWIMQELTLDGNTLTWIS